MKTIRTINELRRIVNPARRAGKVIALVPTMGNLHAGHLSLIRRARAASDVVIVSIFVNPTQFGPNEDFATYPRTPDADLDACRNNGADIVFMPAVDDMYPYDGGLTTVSVSKLGDNLCGASRPGHFAGVCTVVSKLFNIAQCDKAFFGMKDFQQMAIIRRMVEDLNFPVEIVACPTVRESDGLAMSSRNSRLTSDERQQAPALWKSLSDARRMILTSNPQASEVIDAIKASLARNAPDGVIDYVKIVHPHTLNDVQVTSPQVLVAVAVKFTNARLIDNILVDAADDRA